MFDAHFSLHCGRRLIAVRKLRTIFTSTSHYASSARKGPPRVIIMGAMRTPLGRANTAFRNVFSVNLQQYAFNSNGGDIVDVQGPPFAESISEGDIRWVKEEGDFVNVDDVVAQIETDKTTVEVPAPFAGKIVKFLVPDGEKVTAKQVIYQMQKGGGDATPADSSASQPKEETPHKSPPSASDELSASQPKDESPQKSQSSDSGEVVDVQGPTFAESISEGDIRWAKAEGDSVNVDDVVAQIETDKTTVEVPAPFAGKIVKFLVADGEKVTAKQVLYQMQKGGESGGVQPPPASVPADHHPARPSSEPSQKPTIPKSAPSVPQPPKKPMRSKPAADIGAVKAAVSAAGPLQSDSTNVTGDRSETRVKINRMRLRIAERLKDAQNTYAMLTTFNEVDMTNVIKMRKKYQDAFIKKHGIKLGLMSPFVRASAIALQHQPVVNAVIEGGEIVYRNFCDISIAVATPKGLVVPVVRNVENMNYATVEKTLAELGAKARDAKIAIEDMEGGTFTISNGGVFGSMFGTPIINPPQSAILGMHGIFDRVVAIDGKPEVRPMMYIALTYDHRLIDGREAVLFLLKVKQAVEDPVTILLDL